MIGSGHDFHPLQRAPIDLHQRVRFVLNAKGLPFEEIKLDLLAGDQLKPEYLALRRPTSWIARLPAPVVTKIQHDASARQFRAG